MDIYKLMDDSEKIAYNEFIEKHKKCKFESTIGGKISIEVTPTGLGYCFICKCKACGETEDITNVDNW